MTTVKVNYDYISDTPDLFLILKEGEIISEVLLLEGGWWYGKKSR